MKLFEAKDTGDGDLILLMELERLLREYPDGSKTQAINRIMKLLGIKEPTDSSEVKDIVDVEQRKSKHMHGKNELMVADGTRGMVDTGDAMREFEKSSHTITPTEGLEIMKNLGLTDIADRNKTSEKYDERLDITSSKFDKDSYDEQAAPLQRILKAQEGMLKDLRAFDAASREAKAIEEIVDNTGKRLSSDFAVLVDWKSMLVDRLTSITTKKHPGKFKSRPIVLKDRFIRKERPEDPDAGDLIVVIVDCSGSVVGDKGALTQIMSEIKSICTDCQFERLDLICFSEGILSNYCQNDMDPEEISKHDWTLMKPPGGGTNYGPVYRLIYERYITGDEENNIPPKTPDAFILFSDTDICGDNAATCFPGEIMWPIIDKYADSWLNVLIVPESMETRRKCLNAVLPGSELLPLTDEEWKKSLTNIAGKLKAQGLSDEELYNY